jgi:hypothetical protein
MAAAYEVPEKEVRPLLTFIQEIRESRNKFPVGTPDYNMRDQVLDTLLYQFASLFTDGSGILHEKFEVKTECDGYGPPPRPTLSRYAFDIAKKLRDAIPGPENVTPLDVKTPPKL